MKSKHIFIFLFAALTSFYACNDLMDKGPLDKIGEDVVWSDISLAEAFINHQYKVLPQLSWFEWSRAHQLSCFTDEASHKYDYHNLPQYRTGAMTPTTATGLDVWQYHYGYIRGCNVFLENVDKVPADSDKEKEMKNRLKGEAYALRAWSYLDLAARYGGVVLLDAPFKLDDDFKRDRSTFDATIEFIVKDLDAAAELLPDSYDDANWGRITKGTALAIKSRALLYAASPLFNTNNDVTKWQKAAQAAKAVIDHSKANSNLYALHGNKDTYKDVFMSMKNSEMMLIRAHEPTTTYYFFYFQTVEGLGGGIDGNGYCGGWSTTMVSQNLVDAFEMEDGSKFDWNNPEHAANPYKKRDPRLHVAVTHDGSTWIRDSIVQFWVTDSLNRYTMPRYLDNNFSNPDPDFKISAKIYGRNSLANPKERGNCPELSYLYRKSMDETYETDAEQYAFPVSWIILRYAEVYLNYAEASFEAGDAPTALEYINYIRDRVGMPKHTSIDREKIRHERRIELCLEGHRYFDARRWLIAEQAFSQTIYGISIVKDTLSDTKVYTPVKFQERTFPKHYYLQPIPIAERQRSGIDQNPGYTD